MRGGGGEGTGESYFSLRMSTQTGCGAATASMLFICPRMVQYRLRLTQL